MKQKYLKTSNLLLEKIDALIYIYFFSRSPKEIQRSSNILNFSKTKNKKTKEVSAE